MCIRRKNMCHELMKKVVCYELVLTVKLEVWCGSQPGEKW